MSQVQAKKPYLLIGSNIRFLAENAVRHGHSVFTVDYYGDWDTRKLCPNKSVLRDGDGDFNVMSLVSLAKDVENSGIVFGPGFENSVKAALSLKKFGTVLGCDTGALQKTRKPESLVQAAATWGFKYPDIMLTKPEINSSQRWLAKPYDSLGGVGIADAFGPEQPQNRRVFYQRFIEGMSSSAAIVSDGSNATVLGIMTQIIGDGSFGASGFRYAGNVFPHPFAREAAAEVAEIAEALTLEFNLKGLWGFDFIFDGSITLIEVNPRPTAGMGLLGIATLNDLLAMHIDTVTKLPSGAIFDPGYGLKYMAQARVFAQCNTIFSGGEEWLKKGARDIPEDGYFISNGAPVLTLTESDSSYSGVLEKLREEAKRLLSILSFEATSSAS